MYKKTVVFSFAMLALMGCKNDNEVDPIDINPELTLDNPEAASWISEGTLEASGRAADLESLTVNGDDVAIVDNRYAQPVEMLHGLNVVEVKGVDANEDEHFVRHGALAGTFESPGALVDDAVALRVNQGGLEDAFAAVTAVMTPEAMQAAITNPIYEGTVSVAGFAAVEATANIEDIDDPADGVALSFGAVSAWPDPSDAGLEVTINIPDVLVELGVTADILGWETSTTATVSADTAELIGNLVIGVDDGDLTVELTDPTVELFGFGYSVGVLPEWFTDYFFAETIRGVIEANLLEQINEIVPTMLEEQLAGLDFSFETELLGRTLAVSAQFATADTDSYGLALGLDIDAEADSQGTHTYAGYLVSGDDEAPDVSKSSDIAMAASDDLLNRVLFEVWRSGVMDMTMTTTDGSLDEGLLAALQADRGSIEISANLPPVVVEKQGDLLAQFGEMEIIINTPGGGLGEFLEIVLFIEAPVEMAITDGAFGLTLEEPETVIMVRNSDWEASNEAITNLMEVLLPTDDFTSLMSNLEIPLPSLGTLTISSAQIARNTGTDFHTGIELALN